MKTDAPARHHVQKFKVRVAHQVITDSLREAASNG